VASEELRLHRLRRLGWVVATALEFLLIAAITIWGMLVSTDGLPWLFLLVFFCWSDLRRRRG
jgi:hypothetical protein